MTAPARTAKRVWWERTSVQGEWAGWVDGREVYAIHESEVRGPRGGLRREYRLCRVVVPSWALCYRPSLADAKRWAESDWRARAKDGVR